ncbi:MULTISPECIES: hypothetical protein [Serratia]|uniref:Uncharacterized protein n=1 Tax=Serratia quinivorans TaxID=137545 RepID=A0A379ZYW9_9GAMM|nr:MULTISPECIES: hypothetical protein [Serratia]CAI1889228.1 Uncharacterised protein [Serratia quinivorans]SUI70117.1 Uncharacterised protein [Serratia quinivorans]
MKIIITVIFVIFSSINLSYGEMFTVVLYPPGGVLAGSAFPNGKLSAGMLRHENVPYNLTPNTLGFIFFDSYGREWSWISPQSQMGCYDAESSANTLNHFLTGGIHFWTASNPPVSSRQNEAYIFCTTHSSPGGVATLAYVFSEKQYVPVPSSCLAESTTDIAIQTTMGKLETATGSVIVACDPSNVSIRISINAPGGGDILDLNDGTLVKLSVCASCGSSMTTTINGRTTFTPTFSLLNTGNVAKQTSSHAIFKVDIL